MMATNWLPTWVALLWSAGFLLVLAVHLRYTIINGRARLWHATHVLMALGMLDMFWPSSTMPVERQYGLRVFALTGICTLTLFAVAALREEPERLLWEVTVIDLAALIYIFARPGLESNVVTRILSGWFVLETIVWASTVLIWAAARPERSGVPSPTAKQRANATAAPAPGAAQASRGRGSYT
jgi:hypothetical protein